MPDYFMATPAPRGTAAAEYFDRHVTRRAGIASKAPESHQADRGAQFDRARLCLTRMDQRSFKRDRRLGEVAIVEAKTGSGRLVANGRGLFAGDGETEPHLGTQPVQLGTTVVLVVVFHERQRTIGNITAGQVAR